MNTKMKVCIVLGVFAIGFYFINLAALIFIPLTTLIIMMFELDNLSNRNA